MPKFYRMKQYWRCRQLLTELNVITSTHLRELWKVTHYVNRTAISTTNMSLETEIFTKGGRHGVFRIPSSQLLRVGYLYGKLFTECYNRDIKQKLRFISTISRSVRFNISFRWHPTNKTRHGNYKLLCSVRTIVIACAKWTWKLTRKLYKMFIFSTYSEIFKFNFRNV